MGTEHCSVPMRTADTPSPALSSELQELNGSLYSTELSFLLVLFQLHKRGYNVVKKNTDSGARLPSLNALPLTSCVTSNMLLNLSVLQFSHLQHGMLIVLTHRVSMKIQ